MIPRYEHLALVSGLPKSTFFDYGNVNNPSVPSQMYSETIQKAKNMIAGMESSLAAQGKIPAPVYIFREKNFSGLKDVQEIKAVPITDAAQPKNSQEILDALPEAPNKETLLDDSDFGEK